MHSPQTQISSWAMLPAALAPILAIVFAITPISYAGSSADGSNSSGSSGSVAPGRTLTGKASLYPNVLSGHETASGDTFHQSDHTAASNKLPLGTTAKVTNLKTGKSTDVTVTDRGPALGGHKIDLTKKAARDIGLTRKEGVAPVKIKVIGTPDAAP
jgi:rare lipoprotein A